NSHFYYWYFSDQLKALIYLGRDELSANHLPSSFQIKTHIPKQLEATALSRREKREERLRGIHYVRSFSISRLYEGY
ncbi:hypothetical protein, partial [Vibrio cholerae]|uniref:hypothetical protein n=1 Tax=Vibrio cholerae TaxID=666 RepID=UPI001F3ACA34